MRGLRSGRRRSQRGIRDFSVALDRLRDVTVLLFRCETLDYAVIPAVWEGRSRGGGRRGV